jgi:hypothetical protein
MTERIAGLRSLGIFTLFFIIAFPAISHALCEATLEWDPSGSSAHGYIVYGREEGQDYDYDAPWWQGDNSFSGCTIDELEEDRTYFFVVRAYAADQESADSNEVRFSYTNPDGESSSLANPDGETSSLSNGTATAGVGSGSSGCFIDSLF